MTSNETSGKKKKKVFWLVILILALLGCGLCIGKLMADHMRDQQIQDQYEDLRDTVAELPEETTEPVRETTPVPEETQECTTEEPAVGIPINFAELQAINPHVYAWIEIPDTNINYPMLQHPEDDAYYLTHTMYGEVHRYGSIYTERINSKDFTDPNTLIYGHNTSNRSMFQNIRYFTDQKYFDEHPYIYIYTPERKLTYQVVSCYVYDDRHIMHAFDFTDPVVYEEYLDYIQNPRDMAAKVRDGITLTTEDRIITLSTCVGTGETSRRLLHGVLIRDERAVYEEPIND